MPDAQKSTYDIDTILALPTPRDAVRTLYGEIFQIYTQDANVSDAEETLYAMMSLIYHVSWDGFAGWFSNGGGSWAPLAYAGLKQCGAVKTAAIVEKALSVFPGGKPATEQEEYEAQMEQLDTQEGDQAFLKDLDAEFFKFEEDLDSLLYQYVVQHKQEFRSGG